MAPAAAGRRLRALVIHDTDFIPDATIILGTEFLDFCNLIDRKSGIASSQMMSWRDAVAFLQTLSAGKPSEGLAVDAEPDLLLIDCKFDSDSSAPPLQGDVIQKDLADPRGLLYGAVLTAYYLGREPDRPFGFAIYSQALDATASDPYAVTFFSLLEALAGRARSELITYTEFQQRMSTHSKAQQPLDVVPEALQRYRRSLLRCFPNRLWPDIDSFHLASQAVAAAVAAGESTLVPDDLAIRWTNAVGRDEAISLRSFAADCVDENGFWDAETLRDVRLGAYFDRVIGKVDLELQVYEPVMRFFADPDCDLKLRAKDWGHQQRVLALTVVWARNRCDVERDRVKRGVVVEHDGVMKLYDKLGLGSRDLNLALGRLLGGKLDGEARPRFKASAFIKKLNGNESPFGGIPYIRHLTQRVLDADGHEERFRPDCLRRTT
ncbi:MAG TPA: hypothetical protein VGD01_10605 [Candidatus Elarobacter sp.]